MPPGPIRCYCEDCGHTLHVVAERLSAPQPYPGCGTALMPWLAGGASPFRPARPHLRGCPSGSSLADPDRLQTPAWQVRPGGATG
jgi:hypothetical protein